MVGKTAADLLRREYMTSSGVLMRQEQVAMGSTVSGEMLTRQEQVAMGSGSADMLTRQEHVVMGTGSGEMLRAGLQIKTYILKWKCHKSSQNSSLAIAK